MLIERMVEGNFVSNEMTFQSVARCDVRALLIGCDPERRLLPRICTMLAGNCGMSLPDSDTPVAPSGTRTTRVPRFAESCVRTMSTI